MSAALLSGCAGGAKDVPSGALAYAAMQSAAPQQADDSYLLGPGDRISILVYGQTDMSLESVIIGPQGLVSMPLLGPVKAVGTTAAGLAKGVESNLRPAYLRNPQVTVNVLEYTSKQVAVGGQVNSPGVITIFGNSDLTTVLAKAGGPAQLAKLNEVIVVRQRDGQRMAARFDIRAINEGSMADPVIYGGDKVFVGYNSAKGFYQDAIRTLPLFALFQSF
ncbi:polysaccharide biosynthesis/export family protein [Sphingomonas faeni]|uniref:polysaccharide biosynthesis/export family protein n=1 Tax=Sphingomonas faeni TaxID=185950 RepID=UPI00277F6B17|nr:polysaccharide biosynthesis/export family protein [Sphingomonas faeni]MDQ0838829.1 polysaccharide export outer membrane protein [Sphingomonas faeni]